MWDLNKQGNKVSKPSFSAGVSAHEQRAARRSVYTDPRPLNLPICQKLKIQCFKYLYWRTNWGEWPPTCYTELVSLALAVWMFSFFFSSFPSPVNCCSSGWPWMFPFPVLLTSAGIMFVHYYGDSCVQCFNYLLWLLYPVREWADVKDHLPTLRGVIWEAHFPWENQIHASGGKWLHWDAEHWPLDSR